METLVLPATPDALSRAAAALRAGEVVGMPTETVYGLAAVVFDARAVASIFAVKERPTFDPLIVHVAEPDGWAGLDADARLAWLDRQGIVDLEGLDPVARERAGCLMAAFWPGPLTIVVPKCDDVPDVATSGLRTVAVRMPRHPAARALIIAAGAPLAAPSANRFGSISPTTAADVVAELGGRVGLVLDGGPCEVGLESTVVMIEPEGELVLLRPGGVTAENIAKATGVETLTPAGPVVGPSASPGLLERHYAPRRPLVLLRGPAASLDAADWTEARAGLPAGARSAALIVAAGEADRAAAIAAAALGIPVAGRALSRAGDPVEAAQELFATMRAVDASGADVLLAEPWPSADGLGHAIRDRLQRASR